MSKMIDKEINDTIVTGVMGWIIAPDGSLWIDSKTPVPAYQQSFSPVGSYSNGMQAWIKFSEGYLTSLSHIGGRKKWIAEIIYPNEKCIEVEDEDPLRAMCLCMVEVVEEQKGAKVCFRE